MIRKKKACADSAGGIPFDIPLLPVVKCFVESAVNDPGGTALPSLPVSLSYRS